MACTSDVVVLLPLVPPTATMGASAKREANSSSPITSTPAERASARTGRGGTPGETTTMCARVRRFTGCPPASTRTPLSARAHASADSLSRGAESLATTAAPRARASSAAAIPLSPSPTITTVLPDKFVISLDLRFALARSAKFHGRKAHQREQNGNDPEADDDFRLGPAFLFEVVVNRCHQKNAF